MVSTGLDAERIPVSLYDGMAIEPKMSSPAHVAPCGRLRHDLLRLISRRMLAELVYTYAAHGRNITL